MQRRFAQLDVFTAVPYRGNPLAVVVDGDGLDGDEMQRFANWTNLSETTFLLPPVDPAADYRVRIFTPTVELPFAGHPTLGSCRAWLDHGGTSTRVDVVVQECGVGLVEIRNRNRLAFAAPPLIRAGPVEPDLQERLHRVLGVEPDDLAWADNGPGWVVAKLHDAQQVRELVPDFEGSLDLDLGLVGLVGNDDPDADGIDVEIRAFFPGPSSMVEDPVTGSLNASVAQWLIDEDPSLRRYVARQGTAIGRDGRVFVEHDEAGTIWVGGDVATCISGFVEL